MPDRSATAAPLYEQTRHGILALITDGSYGPGDRLPSESSLADLFGVHRLTARRALEELAREGVVVARKGSGTYVAEARQPLPISVPLTRDAFGPSLRRQLTAAGRSYREILLDVVRDDPGIGVPAELREAGPLCLVRSALDVDGVYWVYSTSWVTQSRVRYIRRGWTQDEGLYGVILNQVGELRSLWRSFLAEPGASEVAEILNVRPGAPILVREGLTADADRVPILYVRRHARADRVRYVVDYDNLTP
jgi:DNA-binding GntR family transcriptional regulator